MSAKQGTHKIIDVKEQICEMFMNCSKTSYAFAKTNMTAKQGRFKGSYM